ncbi:hypothetical protein T484DRAFT_1599383, partial [Baffinella frigidus]
AASDGVECSACEVGWYKNSSGVGGCTACPAGTTNSESARKMLSDCFCAAGYTAASDGVECSACEAGWYKNSSGVGDCTACAKSSYADKVGTATCLACTDGPSSVVEGSTTCGCEMNYTSVRTNDAFPLERVCISCGPGTYTPVKNEGCVACAA